MSRAEQNDVFLSTSFLDGANAAWIEDLYARYEADPNSVSPDWQSFFAALKDDPNAVFQNARGASWKKPHWPVPMNGELVSALDGNWAVLEKTVGEKIKAKAEQKGTPVAAEEVHQATRDSIRAIMMIRPCEPPFPVRRAST